MSKSLKKLIDINRLREFKNKLVGTGSAYVQTAAVDQTIAGTKTFSKPIVGSVTGSSGSCTGNAATATTATTAKACTGNAATATNATYTNWLRTSSHSDHLFHTEWDGAGYFWTYVTTGGGEYRAVRVARSDSAANADHATNAATATTATNSNAANQLQAFVNDNFTGGNHYVKAIRSSYGWSTHLWMCYNNGAKMADEVSVNYANSAGNGVPAGVIIPFAGTSVPTGYLLCNGAAVSRTDYANLFAAIGTLYGAGDGSTTFNLPDARDRVLQGASGTHSAGSYIAAGLPNITGDIDGFSGFLSSNGAFALNNPQFDGAIGDRPVHHGFDFYASRCSSLYGASATVQMAAVATNFIIKY